MKRRGFLKRAGSVGAGAMLAGTTGAQAQPVQALGRAVAPPPRERRLLDDGWRFHAGDVAVQGPRDEETYDSTKAGAAAGAAGRDFDDAGWRGVDLPHDFVVEAPFAQEENLAQGGHIKEVGWYRREIRLDPADRGRHIELQFDGLATTATVWFNGNVVANVLSGYTSTYVDVTAFATFGDQANTVAVRVDPRPNQGWWYEGGGLYRHVWLVKRAPVHIVTDGLYVHPVPVRPSGWRTPVEVSVENIGERPVEAAIEAILFDPQGAPIGRSTTAVTVAPLSRVVARAPIDVASPALWSVERPVLHRVQVTVSVDGAVVDQASEAVGFRTQRFDPDHGFFLNDLPVKLKGVCIHQDHAGLGVALPDSIIEYRLRRLKEVGCNAIRASHNAPTRELLDAADRLGFLVMDENRLFDPSPDYLAMLEWMVRRDRNHPSVILWSVFNEEPLEGSPEGYEMVRRMSAAVKRLDVSRPVTAAMNGGFFKPVNVSQAVDVVGFNYRHTEYDRFHAANPAKPMTSSEDTSAMMTRGEYVNDLKDRHVHDSYDDQAQGHGLSHRRAWKEIATRSYLAGGFTWTGFDYRGEPWPLSWPTVVSSLGIMDLCGFPKAAYGIHQALWIKDRPILAIVPHWTWPGREGQAVKVMVASNVETVALLLNGALVAEHAADPFDMNTFSVPYAPGRLEAVGYRDGRVVARAGVETTGAPARLRLTPDRTGMTGDGRDAMPITVEALDAQGRAVPTADLPVAFRVAGGRVLGVGNGDPNSHEPDHASTRKLYNGLAQLIVQAAATDRPSRLAVEATAPGVAPASLSIALRPGAGRPPPTLKARYAGA